jgi:alpha-D-xyloside xylohydrolase
VADVTFTVVRDDDTLHASCDTPRAPWALAAGERVVWAEAGTAVLSLEVPEQG